MGRKTTKKVFYTADEAAAVLGIPVSGLKKLVDAKRFREYRDRGKSTYRVTDVDYEAKINRLTEGHEPISVFAHESDELYSEDADGSGLLDLTDEADDTALGAELLEELSPGSALHDDDDAYLQGMDEQVRAYRKKMNKLLEKGRDELPSFEGWSLPVIMSAIALVLSFFSMVVVLSRG